MGCGVRYFLHHGDGAHHLPRLANHQGRRNLGHQHSGRLGIRHRQFRLVDRYRPCRHADLRYSFPAESAMTLFAVACAGIFPLIHTGRPWMAYYMFPYPSTMGLWPQFRSPLIWDVFAVSTYGTVSLLFWFVGLLPDLATLRDRSVQKPLKIIYGMLAMGWRGSARHWHRYQSAYLLLAGLATPLVLSVHSVIS